MANKAPSWRGSDFPVSTLAVLLGMLANLVLYIALRFLMWKRILKPDPGGSRRDVTGPVASALRLSREFVVLGIVLGFSWKCENLPNFPHEPLEHLPDLFSLICLMVVFLSFRSIRHCESPFAHGLLNHQQTDEWQGWMQVVFLLSHYFQVYEVQNVVRVLVSSFMWMSGFRSFEAVYGEEKFGLLRCAQVLWRLNFSAFSLSMTMNNMYMVYYLCPLMSFYFLAAFLIIRLRFQVNHDERGIRNKLFVAGLLAYAVWEFRFVYEFLFYPLPSTRYPNQVAGEHGLKHEWHFRSWLDHYSAFFGMLFALNVPQATTWLETVERLPFREMWMVKGFVGYVLLSLTAWWGMTVLTLPKSEFAAQNPHSFFIPLLTYVYFRNLTPTLRHVNLGALANVGKYALESFVLMHHVWLSSNGRTRLILVQDQPRVNLFVVSFVLYVTSQQLYQVTMTSRAIVLPEDPGMALHNLGWAGMLLGAFSLLSWVLHIVRAPLSIYWCVGLFCGGVLFILVFRKHLVHIHAGAPIVPPAVNRRTFVLSSFGILFGIIGVQAVPVMLPAFTKPNAKMFAGPLRSPAVKLDARLCRGALANGTWAAKLDFPFCRDQSALCLGHSWSWKESVERQCGFGPISQMEAISLVSNKHIAFIGDESVYDLAVAVHRLLDPTVGHDVIETGRRKPLDLYQLKLATDDGESTFGTLSIQVVPTISEIIQALDNENVKNADLFVIGAFSGELATPPFTYASKLTELHFKLGHKTRVIVLPPKIVDARVDTIWTSRGLRTRTFRDLRKILLATRLSKKSRFIVDMHSLTTATNIVESLDGARYSSTINAVGAQVFFNGLRHTNPDAPPFEQRTQESISIPANPMRGFLTLAVACLMLYTMDVYAGISLLAIKYIPSEPQSVAWEDAQHHRKHRRTKRPWDDHTHDE